MVCPACGNDVPDSARFCPSCGSAADIGAAATLDVVSTPLRRNPSPTGSISSSTSAYESRYVPGATLADRYRIVSPLGKGGMGEVYRAEDLKLGQTVALKFLPQSLSQSQESLDRFTREVRLARQVSHPNVCRVFDIGEITDATAAGKTITHTFLTMEFVDGEDLASLMRRIGRLPSDKAVEIARQMCAGLAAAHEHGIIHRDLKPANIMLDGRGRVRITDFGLAGIAAEIGADARAGTPAYMSPEQFAGRELTPKNDLYSLGLVLYEIFTGKRPFDATTTEEMARLRDKSAPTVPSQYVRELDPLVERVILRCLEKDPAKRPASALQVAAALPGGDPLAAALAAGETPSPEMVAASGETEGLRPAVSWALLALTIAFTMASVMFSAQAKLYRRVPLEKTPEELSARSREILKTLGYSEPPVDTAMSFAEGAEFLRYIEDHDQSKTRWDHLETGAFVFWYRSSPRPLASSNVAQDLPVPGMVTANDPPLEISGMTYVELNPLGQLTQFVAVPPQVEKPGAGGESSTVSPDWTPLFTAAGFDPAKWKRTQPQWTPPSFSDARAAWTGTLAERPELPMRIEAAAFHGQPVYFQLVAPWTTPQRMQAFQPTASQKASNIVLIVVELVILFVGALLARRNLRLGRGDRRGAGRIAAVFFALFTVAWTLATHHVATADEFANFLLYIGLGLSYAVFAWIVYIAMEPYVRRRWPATLVSWSRLLAGNFRDPIVGRDVLAGCVLGAFSIALARFAWYLAGWTGHPPAMPLTGPSWQLLGLRTTIADLSNNVISALLVSFVFLFVLFMFRSLLRKQWAAAIICTLVLTFFRTPTTGQFRPVYLLVTIVLTSLTVLVLIRLGLLAIVVSYVFGSLLGSFPLTTEISAWYSYLSLVGFTLVAALLCYGFYISLAGRPLFVGAMLDD